MSSQARGTHSPVAAADASSYTLQPFQLVKDHRSGCEIGNVQSVLDGSIDELIIAYLRFLKSDKKQ